MTPKEKLKAARKKIADSVFNLNDTIALIDLCIESETLDEEMIGHLNHELYLMGIDKNKLGFAIDHIRDVIKE